MESVESRTLAVRNCVGSTVHCGAPSTLTTENPTRAQWFADGWSTRLRFVTTRKCCVGTALAKDEIATVVEALCLINGCSPRYGAHDLDVLDFFFVHHMRILRQNYKICQLTRSYGPFDLLLVGGIGAVEGVHP